MAKTIEVGIHQLKEHSEKQYQKEYEKWVESWWHWDYDVEWIKEDLNTQNKWLDVDAIQYSVGYSQGDYAYFTGRVLLDKFLDEFDRENEYFVLREAMKLRDCGEVMQIRNSPRWGSNADFDEIEWTGNDEGYFEDHNVVKSFTEHRSVLEGMAYKDYYDICQEMIGNLHTWVKEVCESEFNKLYYTIRDDIEYQVSEEQFIEWCESMDEKFEVEVDDDENESVGDADRPEDCRAAT